jgi:hypothetical protein
MMALVVVVWRKRHWRHHMDAQDHVTREVAYKLSEKDEEAHYEWLRSDHSADDNWFHAKEVLDTKNGERLITEVQRLIALDPDAEWSSLDDKINTLINTWFQRLIHLVDTE